MPLPAVPASVSEAGWKKACGKQYDALDKEHKVSSVLALIDSVLTPADRKAFANLESAIRSGDDVIACYQAMDGVLGGSVEKLKRIAKQHQTLCKQVGLELKDGKDTKAAGVWLIESGQAASKYATEVEAYGDELLDKAEKVPREKISDFSWDLNEWDLTHLLKIQGIKLGSIALPEKKPVAVSVSGKIGAEGAKNAVLRAEFFEAAYAAAKSVAPSLKAAIEDLDENFNRGLVKGNDVPKRLQTAFDRFEADYTKKAEQAIQAIWAELAKDKVEYRTYKIKTVVSIGGKIGGIGVGVASIVTAGWTGAGTVLGLVALVKSTIELVGKIRSGLQEARDLAVDIAGNLEELKTAYEKDGKAVIGAKEIGRDVLARLTSIQLTTVKSVTDGLKLYGSKLQGCNVNATKMGAQIDQLLSEGDALEKKLKLAQDQLKKLPTGKLDKLSVQHGKLMAEVNKLVVAASDYKNDYKTGKVSMVTWMQQVKELEGEVPDVALKVQKWVVPLVDFAYITDVEGVITKTGSLLREYVVAATETENELQQANEIGDLAGDVTSMVVGIIGK